MDNSITIECPNCHAVSPKEAYFCYNCGRQLRSKPEEITFWKQILVYTVSFFLAPFGLGYVFKYLKQDDIKSKIVGYVALALTILAIGLTLWYGNKVIRSTYQSLNLINSIY